MGLEQAFSEKDTSGEDVMSGDPLEVPFDSGMRAQIEVWVRKILQIEEDDVVIIVELCSTTRDCPPVQTVITLMQQVSPTRRYKIHKPLVSITFDDVATLVQR